MCVIQVIRKQCKMAAIWISRLYFRNRLGARSVLRVLIVHIRFELSFKPLNSIVMM